MCIIKIHMQFTGTTCSTRREKLISISFPVVLMHILSIHTICRFVDYRLSTLKSFNDIIQFALRQNKVMVNSKLHIFMLNTTAYTGKPPERRRYQQHPDALAVLLISVVDGNDYLSK